MVGFIRFFVAVGVLASAALYAARAGSAGGAKEEGKVKLTADEAKLLEMTNKQRTEKKLPPLKLNPLLVKAARAHSANMARQQKLEHVLDGKRVGQRLKDVGYTALGEGENIYLGKAGFGRPETALKFWMNSRPHRENILEPNFTEIGIGIARDRDGDVYFTQVFAAPG
jgi:uncharacterized protein YkwD